MKENYDEEVAEGLTEDTSFDLMMVIKGVTYFNFRKHQSQVVMGEYIKFGTGKKPPKNSWKTAFRLKKQYKNKMGEADEYEVKKLWAHKKSNQRVLGEYDEVAIEKKVKKSLED